jgi:hypothetical protein
VKGSSFLEPFALQSFSDMIHLVMAASRSPRIMPTVEELIQAIKDLLDHAVYDAERNDECIKAVDDAGTLLHWYEVASNG